MAGLINELIEVLKKQAVNYDELLVLSKEKRNVIISNDVDMLRKITQAENSIIGRNQRLENKRLAIIKDIASVLNQNADEMTITSLANLIREQSEYSELIAVRDELTHNLKGLKEANDKNALLLDNSLDYINFTINLFRSSLSDEDDYGASKKSSLNTQKGFFDIKQ